MVSSLEKCFTAKYITAGRKGIMAAIIKTTPPPKYMETAIIFWGG
jgi:hypothetical protein